MARPLIFYSIAHQSDGDCERQWLESARSLRSHNEDIDVHLASYNVAPEWLPCEAERLGITVHELGPYSEYLHRLYVHGSELAEYPTFHKFLSLEHLPLSNASQVLYVDCDTFFFDDPRKLFELYSAADWYAREEPTSRRSYLGYDSEYLDEDLLEQIAQLECKRFVAPFNSGVCLLNNGVWEELTRFAVTYLDLAYRLMSGALAFPSNNSWIIEQIALWLTLAKLPALSFDFLRQEHVSQNGECVERARWKSDCVVAHYFSKLERAFFDSWQNGRD